MTPEITSAIVPAYRFRCFCGAAIVTTDKTASACANCGQTFGIRRVRKHTQRRWHTASRIRPHRKLQLEDLEELAIRIGLYLLSGYYVYDLLHC